MAATSPLPRIKLSGRHFPGDGVTKKFAEMERGREERRRLGIKGMREGKGGILRAKKEGGREGESL